jgi:hypothetical protein
MARQRTEPLKPAALKAALRRRIRQLYQQYNVHAWQACYRFIDPRLRQESRIDPARYAESLADFGQRFGEIRIWHVDLSLHLEPRANKHDTRPFAFAYVFWQDGLKTFHVFRERWILDAGRWYTRVVGLVAQEGINGE